jgi:hypothetical protein
MFYPSLIGNAVSSAQASAAQSTAQDAQRKATGVEEKIEVIKYDIERLLMITEALWTILKKQHGYEDIELTKLVAEIDLRDGKLDGRIAVSPPQPCPFCGHTLGKKRPFCIYCGQPVPLEPFAR